MFIQFRFVSEYLLPGREADSFEKVRKKNTVLICLRITEGLIEHIHKKYTRKKKMYIF